MEEFNINKQNEVIETKKPFLINGDPTDENTIIIVFDDYNEFNTYIENKYPNDGTE